MFGKNIDLENSKLDKYEKKYNEIFSSDDFLDYEKTYIELNKKFPEILPIKLKYFFSYSKYRKYVYRYNLLNSYLKNIRFIIDDHNKLILKKEKEKFNKYCGLVENKQLDNQQIDSIIRKDKNQLIIAGAGSGKTTTIVGKVKYLLNTKQVSKDELLLLSFTNAAASEMKERIKTETGYDLDVFTFHKLGLNIIKESSNQNVEVYDKGLYTIINEFLNENIYNHEYFEKLIYFLSTARYDIKDEFSFSSETEYLDYLVSNPPTTLKGEIVKSYGELEIANFLFKNNIEYVYEKDYKYETTTLDHQQYKPDFYLPKYDIYIEYFGIDENGNVAPFFKSSNGKTPSQIYNESINWKRMIHKEYKTTMIETYYYENKNGTLISNLINKLKKFNVEIIPKTDEQLWNDVIKNNSGIANVLSRTFETIINLIKSNNYSIEYLYRLPEVTNSNINMLTLYLIKPIYEKYQQILINNNMIDFNDMINIAINDVQLNKYHSKYKYVIVDEYQDMSNSRYRLLKALRNQNDYKLFCVGDDWQSIYRFNGSDISLITDFELYWGPTYINYIERTYRFTSMLSKLSGNFIMRNPKQFKKNIDADISTELAVKFINGYTQNKCIDFLIDQLCFFEKDSSVFLLGRYSFDIDILKDNKLFYLKYNAFDNTIDIIFYKRKDLKIKFLTIHKSKGLQADYVVILNNKNFGLGFPSKISELPIINILLGGTKENYKYAEERRLFYVALTRSRKQTILLTVDNNKSIFVLELEQDYNNLMKMDKTLKNNIYKCPKCGGKLKYIKGQYGPFFGCENYPNCVYRKKV